MSMNLISLKHSLSFYFLLFVCIYSCLSTRYALYRLTISFFTQANSTECNYVWLFVQSIRINDSYLNDIIVDNVFLTSFRSDRLESEVALIAYKMFSLFQFLRFKFGWIVIIRHSWTLMRCLHASAVGKMKHNRNHKPLKWFSISFNLNA